MPFECIQRFSFYLQVCDIQGRFFKGNCYFASGMQKRTVWHLAYNKKERGMSREFEMED